MENINIDEFLNTGEVTSLANHFSVSRMFVYNALRYISNSEKAKSIRAYAIEIAKSRYAKLAIVIQNENHQKVA